jgi:RNA polymerase sigma-70 factor, ECF subfamily
MEEKQAIELCLRHRDPAGFEHLVRQFRREAYMHAFAMLGNAEDAADVCQDSFARAYAALPRVRKLERFYPWFYTILRNSCLNLLARKKTAEQYRVREAAREEGADAATPDLLLAQTEEQRQVWAALSSLEPEFREILAMKYLEGRRYEEIAQLIGIPRGTVMSRLFYARQAFRDAFTKLEGIEPRNTYEHRS